MKTTELKPCPFCGGKAEISEQEIGDCNPMTYYGVTCSTKGCYIYENDDPCEDSIEGAIERWNDRNYPDLSRIKKLIENQKELDPKIVELVDKHFWELV